MAKLDALPSIDIIHGLRGILDFYYWKGIPCVRKWPVTPPSRVNPKTRIAAALFGAVIRAYALVGARQKAAYDESALDQPRTGRDLYVSSAFGRLHEAHMSDFLTLLIDCRDFLSNLTDLLHALDSIDTDELVVNVDESVLPTGASTAANQATAITALQKLDDLQDALESVALDRLLVRGMDQLHSFKEPLAVATTTQVSGAGGFIERTGPPAGQIWLVAHIMAVDYTSATTSHEYIKRVAASDYEFDWPTQAFAAGDRSFHHHLLWLKEGDTIRVTFAGSLLNDWCGIELLGYIMTLET